MNKICKSCKISFEISEEDRAFYKRIAVPEPTLCPEDRSRRRIVWRNIRHLFKRSCDKCGKKIIAMYPPECKFPIYCPECFWGDKWNPLDYGVEIDFGRSFFEQFAELLEKVPQLSIFQANCVNSEYTLNCLNNKNCYLTSGADYSEDSMYAINSQRCVSCSDHYLLYDCELCYGCLDSSRLYHCVGCQNCESCRDCWFLFDCKNCKNCAFSGNLRNKQYVFENRQLGKEEYEAKLAERVSTEIAPGDADWLTKNLRKIREASINRDSFVIGSENCLGNYVRHCKNSKYVFDAEDLEDCRFVFYGLDLKDCYDCDSVGWGELNYEIIGTGIVNSVYFSSSAINATNIQYCRCIWNSRDCFGSTSLHSQNQYVILNRQYERSEYFKMIERVIKHMKTLGEYGEFFPPAMSPFEYNRSMAIDYLPITREEVLKRGFRWYDGQPEHAKSDDARQCEACGLGYRVIAQEINLYKRIGVPEPKLCWPCRFGGLLASRRPSRLFAGTCGSCGAGVRTPIAPEGKEKVYCEKCYLDVVY